MKKQKRLTENLNELSKTIHEDNCKKGFYDTEVTISQQIVLIHSELSEAIEADRKGGYAPKELIASGDFEKLIKNTFEDEIADSIIRLLDLCGHRNIDIEKHINMKLEYNKKREYKHGKKY